MAIKEYSRQPNDCIPLGLSTFTCDSSETHLKIPNKPLTKQYLQPS